MASNADDSVPKEEDLGRGVFSSRHVKAARRYRVSPDAFLERPGRREISVERLSRSSLAKALKRGERAADRRNRRFYGWAVVAVAAVLERSMKVKATPTPENRWHADIVLPEPAAEDKGVQRQYAQKLADASRWRPRPDGEK